MNKFTQTVNVITYNTISIKTMPHPCTCLESRKKNNISCQVLREQNENNDFICIWDWYLKFAKP